MNKKKECNTYCTMHAYLKSIMGSLNFPDDCILVVRQGYLHDQLIIEIKS